MLFTCKWVMVEYNTLIVKMWEDHIESETLQGPLSKSCWMCEAYFWPLHLCHF